MSERGSDQLLAKLCGAEGPVTDESLAAAVEQAQQEGFRVVRWWWFGQPAIDHITQVIDVDVDRLGPTMNNLVKLHGRDRTINLEVFPYGIPVLDRIHIQVETRINTRRG